METLIPDCSLWDHISKLFVNGSPIPRVERPYCSRTAKVVGTLHPTLRKRRLLWREINVFNNGTLRLLQAWSKRQPYVTTQWMTTGTWHYINSKTKKHKRKFQKKIINISIHKVKKSGEKGNLGIFTTLAPILSISPKWTQTSRRKMRKESLGVVSGGCVERRVVVLHISGGSDRCLEASRPWVPCGEQILCKWMLYGFVSEGIRCYDLECLCIFFCMVELHCAGRKP